MKYIKTVLWLISLVGITAIFNLSFRMLFTPDGIKGEASLTNIMMIGCQQNIENRKTVKIKDDSLEKLVGYTLDKPKGNLYENELKTIKRLSYGKNRSMLMSYLNKKLIELEKQMGDSIDLTELKYIPNLESIDFYGIKVENIEALLY